MKLINKTLHDPVINHPADDFTFNSTNQESIDLKPSDFFRPFSDDFNVQLISNSSLVINNFWIAVERLEMKISKIVIESKLEISIIAFDLWFYSFVLFVFGCLIISSV